MILEQYLDQQIIWKQIYISRVAYALGLLGEHLF